MVKIMQVLSSAPIKICLPPFFAIFPIKMLGFCVLMQMLCACLVVGLHLDTLQELEHSPGPPSCSWGDKGRERNWKGGEEGGKVGGEGRESSTLTVFRSPRLQYEKVMGKVDF